MSRLFHGLVTVQENVRLARDTYRIRLDSPDLAAAIAPGQFIMLRWPQTTDPLLGRPFALYDTALDASGTATGIDIVYLVVGKMTALLAHARASQSLEAWGPLGNGFPRLEGTGHVGLVAGGIGQTPFLAYARQLLGQRGYAGASARRAADHVSIYYGVRTADLVAGVEDFQSTGASLHLATDDGTRGFRGFVTDLVLKKGLAEHLVGCGPAPMLRSLAELARRSGTPCHLSLESPMACGIGICFSCVTRIRIGADVDYRRICVDGPVFDAACLADL
jgi:dihydroorotate dehydrogenase electron transfer subunit